MILYKCVIEWCFDNYGFYAEIDKNCPFDLCVGCGLLLLELYSCFV
jgi:hypothetical protein